VEAQEPPVADAVAHHRLGDAVGSQLPPGHDAVLRGGKSRLDRM
jgi:hypothetical protein